ncbi:MAG: hypothetical protein ACYTDU_01605 [Planctomycetota bacterium]|jgi:hypothetical protein
MRRLVLWATLVVAVAGCGSATTKRGGAALVFAEADAAAVWIGLASDGITYYRLVLGEEATGMCGTAAGKDEKLYRIRRWSVEEENRLVVHLELVDGGSLSEAKPLLTLNGTQQQARLDLVAQGLHSITLWREPDVLTAVERLRARMR